MGEASDRLTADARVAGPEEGVSLDELQLAARNHGMPLEALRYDVTPIGLHYLLTHYDIPYVDPSVWSLTLGGLVRREVTLTLADLQLRPAITSRVTMECAGNGRARLLPRPVSQPWLNEAVGTAEWTGTALAPLLAECGIEPGAVEIVFTGADHGTERGVEQDYERGLSLADALDPDVLLVYAMNGQPLPPQHGAPLRLIAPGWYGMAHVKWLTRITVIDKPFVGFQNAVAYRIREPLDDATDPAALTDEPVTRIKPRALMQPPGFPDFMSRVRVVEEGTHVLSGRAWSGTEELAAVEVSVDSGANWHLAELQPRTSRWAWRAWTYDWRTGEPGETELSCRATDTQGATQPTTQPWNRQGMANTLVQRIPVVVRRS